MVIEVEKACVIEWMVGCAYMYREELLRSTTIQIHVIITNEITSRSYCRLEKS